MGLVRAKLIVTGEVQKVGYRDLVQRVARRLGVKGFVENLRDGAVRIICEVEEEVLEDFVKMISVREDFIDVERVRVVETSSATGEFDYFDIRYSGLEEELGDRMVMAVNFAKATRKEIGGVRAGVKGVHSEVKGMRSEMIRNFGGMSSEIKEMRSDMNRNFQEMAKRYDAISSELIKTRKELTRAVDNMSKLIDEFIKARRKVGD